MSKTSLTSDNAKSVEMLTSLAQLNGMDEDEMAVRMNGSEEQLPVREKLSKRFGIISLTQRNLTVDEATTKPTLRGVVSIKVRRVRMFRVDDYLQESNNVYVEISTRNITKKTSVAPNVAGVVEWEQVRHFPVAIPRNRRHPFNLVSVDVLAFDGSGMREAPNQVGSLSFHLHDIIAVRAVSGAYEIWDDYAVTGLIDMEITFNYGLLGYGYCNQLSDAKLKTEDMIVYSLFPRIVPQNEDRESQNAVRVVRNVPHPDFLPIEQRATLRHAKIYGQSQTIEREPFQPKHILKDMGIVSVVRDTLQSITDHLGRLLFLHSNLTHDARRPTTIQKIGKAIEMPKVQQFVTSMTKPLSPQMGDTNVRRVSMLGGLGSLAGGSPSANVGTPSAVGTGAGRLSVFGGQGSPSARRRSMAGVRGSPSNNSRRLTLSDSRQVPPEDDE